MARLWRILSASVVGTSHTIAGTPCQDFSLANVLHDGSEDVLLCACADGAGSARYSELASKVACESLCQRATHALTGGKNVKQITNNDIADWFRFAHLALAMEAEKIGADHREFATTALIALVGECYAVFGQIGDGAIVVNSEQRPVFWPENGEYFNATVFLTDDSYEQCLRISTLEDQVDELALFTDGLQLLTLNYGNQTVHRPFFESMFRVMRECSDVDRLRPELIAFLDSEPVNSRTDDDKTLILAQRVIDER